MKSPIIVRDVGLRDGLQSISTIVPTAAKKEWIRLGYEAGQRHMEVGSFVPAKLMPQLADTAELVAYAKTFPGLVVTVLVPNLKGAEFALATDADAMILPFSASHAHSLANLRKTPEQVVDDLARIVDARNTRARATPMAIEVGISTAFGCTIQGKVETDAVLTQIEAVEKLGVDSIGLADTVGYADPLQVSELFKLAMPVSKGKLNRGHFHDTRGMAAANSFAAWQQGATMFDASIGGFGGCPHAPGASGNIATEDLVYMFHSMGIHTGMDFEKLLALRAKVGEWIAGNPLGGSIWKSGLPKTMRLAV